MTSDEEMLSAEERRTGTVQSVQRALHLLSFFAPHRTHLAPPRSQWSVSDLARASGLHKSVVARLMATMALDGFVVQDPVTKSYRIGPQAFAVGSRYEPLTLLNRVARPIMERLSAQTGHGSYLGVPAGDHYVFLIAVESTRSVRVTIEVGERRAYHAGAIGKVLLAAMDDASIRDLVGPDPLPKLTPRTIDSLEALMAEIAEVRRTGVAFNREEAVLGAGSVAVGIRNGNGLSTAGLAVVYPTHIVAQPELEDVIEAVRQAGADVSRHLGALGA